MASRTQYQLEILLGARTASNYQSSINNAKNGMSSISSHAKRAAGLITAAFAAVNVTGAIKDAIEVYSGFEQELTNSAAIAGATNTEYVKMEEAARDAGKATTKTAAESASALGYMALAGWDVNESTQSLMPVLKLSEATNLDLAETSDLVTDSMSALKLEVDDLPEYLDLVTKANNSSNTTSEQLMQAFIKTGGAARTLKIGVQDTGTALGILANNGTKAEEGGRSLNAMLTRIGSNKNAQKQMKELGIEVFDSKGKFVGLEEGLKRINKGLSGLSVKDKAKAMKEIAGTNYYSKMAYLLDGVKEGANGAESAWDDLEVKLANSEGTLDEMDSKITGTSEGALKKMQSALDDAKISFGDAFSGEYVDILNLLGDTFNDVSESISDFASENEVEIHQAFKTVGEDIAFVGRTVGNFAGFVADNFDLIESGVVGIGIALGTYKVANGILGIGTSLASLASSPVAWIAGAGAAIAALGVYSAKSHDKMVKANLAKHFGNISLSLEDLDEISQEIVGKKKLTQISTMLESIGKTDEAIEDMSDSLNSVNKISWKLNAGFELDTDDTESYTSSVKDYVDSAQSVLDNQGYTVSIATDLLLGKNSTIGNENNAFYSGLDAQMNSLEKKLNKKIKKAVKNGVDIDTDSAIQTLLEKMNTITCAVTDAENEAELQSIGLKYSGKDLTSDDFKQLSEDIKKYEEQATSGADNAYKTSMTTLNARLNMGDISQEKYDDEAKTIKQGYYDTKSDAMSNGSEYILNTVKEAYPELNASWDSIQDDLVNGFNSAIENGVSGNELSGVMDDVVDNAISNAGISDTTSDAVTDIFKSGLGGIWSDMEDLEGQIKNQGMNVPKSLSDGITDTQALSAITGSADDAYILLGKEIGESDQLSTIVNTCKKAGAELPDGVADGIDSNKDKVVTATNNLLSAMEGSVEGKLSAKISMDMVSDVAPITKGEKKNAKNAVSNVLNNINPSLHRNAKGGIYSNPILTTFAEEGPEAAVPLDGTNRAKEIWRRAGQILGVKPKEDNTSYGGGKTSAYGSKGNVASSNGSQSGAVYISYAPVIEVKGNADEQTLTKVVKMSQSEFAKMFEQYKQNKGRVAFGN